MRILLLALILAAGACSKKPAPQTPANKAGEMSNDKGATDSAKPADKTEPMDPKTSGADPCGG
jgi:hypothetical protein